MQVGVLLDESWHADGVSECLVYFSNRIEKILQVCLIQTFLRVRHQQLASSSIAIRKTSIRIPSIFHV